MAGYTRVRSDQQTLRQNPHGRYYHPTLGWQAAPWLEKAVWSCTDVVGNRKGDNPFTNVLTHRGAISISGTSGSYIYESAGTAAQSYSVPTHLIAPGLTATQLNQYALQVVAKTNPNAPHVNVPTFIGELKELPELVRSFGVNHLKQIATYRDGRAFAREAASRHLQYRWGIKPMVSDLKKLFDFAAAVQKRLRWFEKLSTGQSLHRRVSLDQLSSGTTANSVALWTIGASVGSGPRRISTSKKIWGSCQWVIDPADTRRFPFTHDARLDAAKRAVFGMNPANLTLTAWELLPWSWFIDWFTGFGDLLGATQNSIPVIHSRVCIMVTTDTYETSSGLVVTPKTLDVDGVWYARRTDKRRYAVGTPTPISFSLLPLTEADKWSILGSLAIQRRRKAT